MSVEILDPWRVDAAHFPTEETRSARLEALVRYAVLAPSTHNTQPWRFRVRQDALEVFADRSRSLPVADPDDRELTISCGAALQFARLTARIFSVEGPVELLPDPQQPDLLARLHLGSAAHSTTAEERRFNAIPERHTSRTPFANGAGAARAVARLAPLARQFGTALATSNDPALRTRVADLVEEADRKQMSDPAFRRELARWVKPRGSSDADGMSLSSFGLNDRLTGAAAAVIRAVDLGEGTAATHHRLAERTPWLGLLSSVEDVPKCWLRTGMALADIVLELTASGISCSFLSQPIELSDTRMKVGEAFEVEGIPQMLLRIGRGAAVPAAARRTPESVTGT